MKLEKAIFLTQPFYKGPLGSEINQAFNSLLSSALKYDKDIANFEHQQDTRYTHFSDLVSCLTSGASQRFTFGKHFDNLIDKKSTTTFTPFASSSDYVEAVGFGSIALTHHQVSNCCVKAVTTGDSFIQSMSLAASFVDQIDFVSAYGLASEVDGARLIKAPIITCLKGAFGNDGGLSEFLNFLFSIYSLSNHCIPFTRNYSSKSDDDDGIVNTRNLVAGDSLKYLLFNTVCSRQLQPISILIENNNITQRGMMWRLLRSRLY